MHTSCKTTDMVILHQLMIRHWKGLGAGWRCVARYLEELENFYPMKEENAQSLEKNADLLDVAVVNISE